MAIALQAKIDFINAFLEKKPMSKNQLAMRTGVHQSQVGRILRGQIERDSRNLNRLFEFAIEHGGPQRPDPRQSEELMAALRYAWDGTEPGALKLAQVIRAVGSLQKSRPMAADLKKAPRQSRV